MASKTQELSKTVLYTTRTHFYYVLAYAVGLIIFDSWNLIPNDGMQQRWTAVGLLLLANVALWYLARNKTTSTQYFRVLTLVLIVADIMFAAYNVYLERGMASRSVILFAVPIVLSASTLSRRTIYASAFVSAAAYVMAITRYFTEHYGEGYKVELYGIAILYSSLFFVLAALLWTIVPKKRS
ncbi:MAG: hypothetical protein KIH63_003955 [Candidatus Saccharibacteria bacterium]|nr:hypothetical protein [Candidatus Saccharibacteria bacterium]